MRTIDPTILGIIMPILFLVWHGAAAFVFREPQRPAARTEAATRHTGSAAPEPTRLAARRVEDQRSVTHTPRPVELHDAA